MVHELKQKWKDISQHIFLAMIKRKQQRQQMKIKCENPQHPQITWIFNPSACNRVTIIRSERVYKFKLSESNDFVFIYREMNS